MEREGKEAPGGWKPTYVKKHKKKLRREEQRQGFEREQGQPQKEKETEGKKPVNEAQELRREGRMGMEGGTSTC